MGSSIDGRDITRITHEEWATPSASGARWQAEPSRGRRGEEGKVGWGRGEERSCEGRRGEERREEKREGEERRGEERVETLQMDGLRWACGGNAGNAGMEEWGNAGCGIRGCREIGQVRDARDAGGPRMEVIMGRSKERWEGGRVGSDQGGQERAMRGVGRAMPMRG
jgi:hypothetical protein